MATERIRHPDSIFWYFTFFVDLLLVMSIALFTNFLGQNFCASFFSYHLHTHQHLGLAASNIIYIFCWNLVQSNAQRAHRNRWCDKLCSGVMGDIGYAPILFCIIIILIILFINSVVAGKKIMMYENLLCSIDLLGIWDVNSN